MVNRMINTLVLPGFFFGIGAGLKAFGNPKQFSSLLNTEAKDLIEYDCQMEPLMLH